MGPDVVPDLGLIVGAVVGGLFLAIVPGIAAVLTVRAFAKHFNRSTGWGWVGLLATLLVSVISGVVASITDTVIDIQSFGMFLLVFIGWFLIAWPISTGFALVPFYLTRKRAQR